MIVLDLIAITAYDVILSNVACAFYVRHAKKGKLILAKSADICGITTYLLGNYFSPINIAITLMKVSLLTTILIIDLDIESDVSLKAASVNSKYSFDPSIRLRGDNSYDLADVYIEGIRQCHTYSPNRSTIKMHPTVFFLDEKIREELEKPSNESNFDPESSRVRVNMTSLLCLQPENVEQPEEEFTVVGCSEAFTVKNCLDITPHLINVTLDQRGDRIYYIKIPSYPRVRFYDDEITEDLLNLSPYYKKSITQYSFCLHLPSNKSEEISELEFFSQGKISCLLFLTFSNNNTLIEMWDYSVAERRMLRKFPGAILNRKIVIIPNDDSYLILSAILLENHHTKHNWYTFSTYFYGVTTRYSPIDPVEITTKISTNVFASISRASLIMCVIFVSLPLLGLILTKLILPGEEEFQQINTIDGLASVLAETGDSHCKNTRKEPPLMGFRGEPDGTITLGPVSNQRITRIRDNKFQQVL